MPAFPFSSITAFAEEGSSLSVDPQSVASYQEPFDSEVLDSYDSEALSEVDESPLGRSIPVSAPNRIYADVCLNGALVESDGSIVNACMNCLEEGSEAISEAKQRMAEEDADAEEALAIAQQSSLPQEEVDAQLLEALEQERVPFDPTLTDQSPEAVNAVAADIAAAQERALLVGPMLITDNQSSSVAASAAAAIQDFGITVTSGSRAAVRATSVAHPDYSIDVTLKDITGFDNVWSDGNSADIEKQIYLGYDDNPNPHLKTYNMGIIRSYAFPTLNSPYLGYVKYPNPDSVSSVDKDLVYMQVRLPVSQGEEAEPVEVLFGPTSGGGNYTRPEKNQWPAINDNTVRAKFANTEGYDASRVIAYQNAYKLAPFASYEDIIKSGNAIPANHPLATKTIRESWPIHETDGMKLGLYEGDEESLVRYMVYFADGTHLVSDMEYLGTRHLAASYVDSETGMLYQPDFWLVGEEGKAGIDWIANFIRSKTWSNYFEPVFSKMTTAPKFNRVIKDHFDEKLHENAEEVAGELVNLMDDWAITAASHQAWRGILNGATRSTPSTSATSSNADASMFNLLFFYTFYDRILGMDIGGSKNVGYRKDANIFKIMAFKGGVINPGLSLKTMTRHMNYTKLYGMSRADRIAMTLFPTALGELTGISNPQTLVERAVKRTTDYTDMNDWFADYMSTFCFYKEYKASIADPTPELEKLTWRGWDQVVHYPNDMLWWMTIQEPGAMYFMSTPLSVRFGSTHLYSKSVEFNDAWRANFESKMNNTGLQEARYAASLTAICEAEQLNKICILGIDQVASNLDGGTSWLDSEGFWGKTLSVDPFHKGYTDPMYRCQRSSQGAAIMTINSSLSVKLIYYFMNQLSANWEYYQSHEMSHAIDNDVFLRGSRRAGTEDYTDGLLTQSYGSQVYIMNLSQDLAMTSDASANLTRERISTKEKLNDFYSKMYEAYDTLDYAMLKAFLKLEKEEQNALAMQLQYGGRDGSSQPDVGASSVTFIPRNTVLQNYDGTDATTPVTSSQFIDGTRKFETPEEVYDNQLVLWPGGTGSFTWIQQLYVSTNLAGVFWHPIHANSTYADSRSFKVQMYRMLGRHGYDAFANFGRTGGGQDLAKLQAITGHDSFRDWQLARWNEIEAGKDTLAYVNFDQLVDKFVDAMRTDAAGGDKKLTQMVNLRWRTYYMMKRVSNDFRYGLHTDAAAPVTAVRTVADLQAMMQNPYGNYVLAADIDVSALAPAKANALLAGTFYGKLDGAGHSLISTSGPLLPLFEGAKHAYIKDMHLEGATSANMAATVNNSEFENITFSAFERNIFDATDLAGIEHDLSMGVRTFHFMRDIDMGPWSIANAAADAPRKTIASIMSKGTYSSPVVFNGNGHVIRNLNGASLLDKAVYTKIHDLSFENCSNLQDPASADCVSIIANHTHECDFTNLYFNDVSLSGRYRVGIVSGNDGFIGPAGNNNRIAGSRFSRIQVNNGSVLNGASSLNGGSCYAGFIAGRVFNSDLEDIFVRGRLTTYGVSCGGLIGAITGSARISRCISNVDMAAGYSGNNGVMVGDIETNGFDPERTSISNCVALGNPGAVSVGRFAKFAADAKSVFHNCYENSDQKNGTSLGFDEQADVSFVRTMFKPNIRVWNDSWKREELPADYYRYTYLVDNQQFYVDMGYDTGLWEYSETIDQGYPVLRSIPVEKPISEYDLDAYLDYKDEAIYFSGKDHDSTKTTLENLWFQLADNQGSFPAGYWWDATNVAFSLKYMNHDENKLDLSRIIDYEKYLDCGEMRDLGYRTLIIRQTAKQSGKSYDFEKLIKIPRRPEMVYADALVGVRADSKGNGSIRLVSVGSYDVASKLEYRLKAPDSHDALAAESPWTTMESTNLTVAPGNYEVRIKATDHSFASSPTTVTVDEFDPNAVIFPLVLDTKGGSWAEGYEPATEFNSEEATPLPGANTISREGYSFTGWYANEACTGQPVTQVRAGETNAVILYAGWRAQEYSVTLQLKGGALRNPLENITKYTHGQEKTLPIPMRNARIFVGWFDNEACEGEPVEAITSSDFGDKQFWAKWIAETYEVSLQINGGTLINGLAESTYERGTGKLLPTANDVAREGYTFVGWYANPELSGDPVRAISATDFGDKEFWARWMPISYRVAFVLNGGRQVPGSASLESYIHGDERALPVPEREGYEFAGWFDNESFSGDPIETITPTDSGDKTFWAKWDAIAYDVSYVMGTDSLGEAPPANAFDLLPFQQYMSGSIFQLPDASMMVWEGHSFAGWYDNEKLEGAPVTEIASGVFGDRTFWAKWVGEGAQIVSYYTNGGTFSTFPKTVFEDGIDGYAKGNTVVLPNASEISKNGYDFEGWYDNPSFTGEPKTSIILEGDNTSFYAKWRAQDYAISYALNGGSWADGYSAPVRYTIESSDLVLPGATEVVRSEHSFNGWHRDSQLLDGVISVLPAGSTGDVDLFAAWRDNQLVVPGPVGPGPDDPILDEILFEISRMQFGDISFGKDANNQIAWDESTGYAKIQLPRSKMPKAASDFNIQVPSGIYVHSIDQRESTELHALSRVLSLFDASAQAVSDANTYAIDGTKAFGLDPYAQRISPLASNSDVWDIELRKVSDPSQRKVYTLEIEPMSEGDSDRPGFTEPGDNPNGPNGPGEWIDMPGTNTPGTNPGSGNGTGNGSGTGSGSASGSGYVQVNPGTPNSGDNGSLAQTGDDTDIWLLVGIVLGAAAISAICFLMQRRRRD